MRVQPGSRSAVPLVQAAALLGSLTALGGVLPYREDRITLTDALARSRGVCELTGGGGGVLSGNPLTVDGDQNRYWSVTCRDVRRCERSWMSWNAATGEMTSLSAWPVVRDGMPEKLRTAALAQRSVAFWIKSLDGVAPGDWHTGKLTRIRGGHAWMAVVNTGSKGARVVIDARSGDLMLYRRMTRWQRWK